MQDATLRAAERANALSKVDIGACIEVHRQLGPGLLESAYEICLCRELQSLSIPFERQKLLPVRYKGELVDAGYRLDLVVDNCLLVELKSVEQLLPIHDAQVLTYLKLSEIKLGLLINFNVVMLKQGVKRVVNKFPDDSSSSFAPLR